jgi:phosphoglycolate phosphatase-like HAD superfamily hydrolase
VKDASLIFWDFDGVIKDSVSVKTEAYAGLFEEFGPELSRQVRDHHDAHGGMSRFEKIPLYLGWAGQEVDSEVVQEFCERFSHTVLQKVIEAPWVAGVERYLRTRCRDQHFVLVSATPQEELDFIVQSLALTRCFRSIFGAPAKKTDIIRQVLLAKSLNPSSCLMIGDAQADLDAAEANQVPFLLRKYSGNSELFSNYLGPSIEDFSNV